VRPLALVLALALPAAAHAQAGDVSLAGQSVVGRWLALDVVGDAEATRDLASGALEKTLVVNPGGQVILRGVDRVRGRGAAASFSGRLFGETVAFRDLPGTARLAFDGRRLVLTDPAGRQTRFIRSRP
jgi:hypothetical protein